MKRILFLFLTLILSLTLVFTLSACGSDDNTADGGHTKCADKDGDGKCDECGEAVAPDEPDIPAHTHDLTKVERVEPTCKTDGNIEYYTCSGCDKKFSLDTGITELTAVAIPAAHTGGTEIRGDKAPTEDEEGYTGDTYCLGCGDKLADGEPIDILPHTHSLSKTEARGATCAENGNTEYYTCSKCKKHYSDENGNNEIALEDTVIPASHSLEHNAEVEATCEEDGNIEYWFCSACKKNYSDADGENEITVSIIIPASHSLEYKVEVKATCDTDGSMEHYFCEGCGKAYYDENAETEITISLILPAKHDLTLIPAIAVDCDSDGRYTHYVCGECKKLYWDDAGKNEATAEETVIVAAHVYVEGKCSHCSYRVPTEGLAYELNEDGKSYTVTGIGEAITETFLVIPSTHNGLPVTAVAEEAFWGNGNLVGITIPESIEEIGRGAFLCQNVSLLEFNAVKMTGRENAPFYCLGYKNAGGVKLIIGRNVRSVPSYTFAYYTQGNTYKGQPNITVVEFESTSSCEAINPHAFYKNTALTSIVVPASVVTVGGSAFYGCTALSTIYFEAPTQGSSFGYQWNSDNKPLVWGYNNIKTNSEYDYVIHGKEATLVKYKGNGGEVVIPETIDGYTVVNFGQIFEKNTSITSITLPDTITALPRDAFAECSNLKSAKLSSNITIIPERAFNKCYALESIEIPDAVTVIEYYAFGYCESLATVTFGSESKLNSTGGYSFYGCTSLDNVVLPDSLTQLYNGMFQNCTSLSNIKFGKNVTDIGGYTFKNCEALTSFTITAGIKNIGYDAFGGSGITQIFLEDTSAVWKYGTSTGEKTPLTEEETATPEALATSFTTTYKNNVFTCAE